MNSTLEAATSRLDVPRVRAQFPALSQQVNGYPAVFLDGPGGTQVPQRVIDAISDYLRSNNANTCGAYQTSRNTDQVLSGARSAMADFLGCDSDEVVFGPNMTTLTFAVSRAIGRELGPGDEIVLTQLDHDANISPWRALEERGVKIQFADIREEDCTLNLDDLAGKISSRTRLLAVGYASNAVGTINDVKAIVRLAHDAGALAYIDAVHYAPHGPIDVRDLDCDFLACSTYKFFGPHLGVLYAKRDIWLDSRLTNSALTPTRFRSVGNGDSEPRMHRRNYRMRGIFARAWPPQLKCGNRAEVQIGARRCARPIAQFVPTNEICPSACCKASARFPVCVFTESANPRASSHAARLSRSESKATLRLNLRRAWVSVASSPGTAITTP